MKLSLDMVSRHVFLYLCLPDYYYMSKFRGVQEFTDIVNSEEELKLENQHELHDQPVQRLVPSLAALRLGRLNKYFVDWIE